MPVPERGPAAWWDAAVVPFTVVAWLVFSLSLAIREDGAWRWAGVALLVLWVAVAVKELWQRRRSPAPPD